MKAVISYLAVLLSAFGYMVLFDRNAGGIMTVFLMVVPVISVFLTLAARKKMKFEIVTDGNVLNKNKPVTVSVCAVKGTFLPVPVISFEFSVSEHFRKPEYDVYRFSMSENRNISVDIELLPEVCGCAQIRAGKLRITDYLGIFRFKLPVTDLSCSVSVMPELRDISDSSELLRSIYSTLPDNDDDSETTPVYGKTAFPGYEYRAYVPGDSLKRINWKLSSKKNELYVRMDEASGMTLPDIILDTAPYGADFTKRSGLYWLEQVTEGALAVLGMCVKNGIECRFIYPKGGKMVAEDVTSADDIERISCEMISGLNEPAPVCFSDNTSSKSADVSIVCALGVSDETAAAAETSVLSGNSVKFIVPEEIVTEKEPDVPELWMLREDFTLSKSV